MQQTQEPGNEIVPVRPVVGHYEVNGGPNDGALVFHRHYPDTGETVYTDDGGQWMQVMPWDTEPVIR